MSTSKSTGSSRLGRDSAAKRLGIKLFAGQKAEPGMIIVRQRGAKYFPGKNVRVGGDDTIYAHKKGVVKFKTIQKTSFDGTQRRVTTVHVVESTKG